MRSRLWWVDSKYPTQNQTGLSKWHHHNPPKWWWCRLRLPLIHLIFWKDLQTLWNLRMSELHKGTSRHPCIELTLERGAHHRAPQRTGQTIQTIQTIRHQVDSRRHPLRHPTRYMTKKWRRWRKNKQHPNASRVSHVSRYPIDLAHAPSRLAFH